MNIGERMKNRRKELKLSADDVAERLGVSRASIYRYEKGDIEKFPIESLIPLSEVLRTTPAVLMGWQDEPENSITYIYDQLEPPRQKYVYGIAKEQLEEQNNVIEFPGEKRIIRGRQTAAGSALYSDDSGAHAEVLSASMVPRGADELVEVVGKSMEPLIKDGEDVYIRHQPQVENGEIAIVRIEGDGVTCKRFYVEGDTVTLKSENLEYEDMHFDPSQVTVLGKVLL